jgi:hypothetical protein
MRERTIKQQIWLNQQEKNLLKEKAKKVGLTESDFLRSCIKGYKIKEQPTEEIKNFQRDITGIANNINQIARIANSSRYISNNDLDYVQNKVIDFILKFEKKIYSRE